MTDAQEIRQQDGISCKAFADGIEWKQLSEDGTFEGYASTFGNVDSDGDVIAEGAFDKSIKEARKTGKYPKLLWQHDTRKPIGVFTEMRKDAEGLHVKGKLFLDIQQAKEAYALLKGGAIDSMSIGFSINDWEINPKTGVRTIKDLRLWETSLVTFPANQMARITGVKTDDIISKRELERNLRDAGYSQNEAKAIVAKAFKATGQRDVDAEKAAEICRVLKQTINILR